MNKIFVLIELILKHLRYLLFVHMKYMHSILTQEEMNPQLSIKTQDQMAHKLLLSNVTLKTTKLSMENQSS